PGPLREARPGAVGRGHGSRSEWLRRLPPDQGRSGDEGHPRRDAHRSRERQRPRDRLRRRRDAIPDQALRAARAHRHDPRDPGPQLEPMNPDDTKKMVETVDVSPAMPEAPSGAASPDVFRQLLHQAVRVADLSNAQAMRMAMDFAKVYEREQGVRKEFELQLRQMALMEKQTTRYAEDLAQMLRTERERREELERALEQERIANEELRRTGLQGISHLLLAATIKDQTTGAHLLRVRKYVEAIGTRLGLPAQIVEEFGYSSVMHDVGKIHTPDHILQSEHHLSSEEFEVIKQHCIDGELMLGDARFFETARAIAREHHERWDGAGYPDGKKGSEISLAARIVSVADVFDALTSKRPYKNAWSLEEGMASITAGSGKQFDPDVVGVFQALQANGTIETIRQEVGSTRLE